MLSNTYTTISSNIIKRTDINYLLCEDDNVKIYKYGDCCPERLSISEKLTDNELDEIVEILNQKCLCCPSEVDNVPSEDNC